MTDIDDLPVGEFAFPGALRDRLVGAILAGAKTATAGLLAGYEADGEPLPKAGERHAVVDSAGRRVAVIALESVRVVRCADVDERHAIDEGEDYTDVAGWRAAHEEFWHGEECLAELGADFRVDDDTPVVLERFRVERAETIEG